MAQFSLSARAIHETDLRPYEGRRRQHHMMNYQRLKVPEDGFTGSFPVSQPPLSPGPRSLLVPPRTAAQPLRQTYALPQYVTVEQPRSMLGLNTSRPKSTVASSLGFSRGTSGIPWSGINPSAMSNAEARLPWGAHLSTAQRAHTHIPPSLARTLNAPAKDNSLPYGRPMQPFKLGLSSADPRGKVGAVTSPAKTPRGPLTPGASHVDNYLNSLW